MRNIITKAVILRKYKIGEIHKGLTIFSSDLGIINIIAHGAYKAKSRFRTATELLSYSKFYLYRNPVNDSYKLTDIEPILRFSNIPLKIKKYFIASFWAEIILKSHAGGSGFTETFNLFTLSMKLLDVTDESKSDLISIQFIIRFLRLNGSMTDISRCNNCGRGIYEYEDAYYSRFSSSVFCKECKKEGYLSLPAEGRSYLKSTLKMEMEEALKVDMKNRLIAAVKNFLYNAVENYLDSPLKSLQSGGGIL